MQGKAYVLHSIGSEKERRTVDLDAGTRPEEIHMRYQPVGR